MGRLHTKREKFGPQYPHRTKIAVEVGRKGRAFQACVYLQKPVGRGGYAMIPAGGARSYQCAHGKNPRSAVAKALTHLTRALRKRPGAFAGLAGLGRRRRRR